MSLKGKIALITGASRGIGAGIAIELAKEGADIAITYVSNADAAQKVRRDCVPDCFYKRTNIYYQTVDKIKALGVRALAIRSDVADLKGHQDLVNKVIAEYGKIDILINNAGVFGMAPLGQITEAEFDRVFNTNTKVSHFSNLRRTYIDMHYIRPFYFSFKPSSRTFHRADPSSTSVLVVLRP